MSDDVRDIRDVLLGLHSSLVGTHLGDVCKRAADEIDRLERELAEAKKWMRHAADIGHFANCRKCGMPMRPGCICEACGWDRTEVSDE